jgi:hypothetical protein
LLQEASAAKVLIAVAAVVVVAVVAVTSASLSAVLPDRTEQKQGRKLNEKRSATSTNKHS